MVCEMRMGLGVNDARCYGFLLQELPARSSGDKVKLYVEHCPCVSAAQSLVQRTCAELGIDAEIRTILIPDRAAAERVRFLGSPTVRVAGRDVEPGVELSAEYTLECRLYRHEHRLAGYPQER